MPVRLRPRHQRGQQQRADPLAAALGVHRDRELRHVGRNEPVARLARVEDPAPRRADGFVDPVERDHREIALAAPTLDVAA